LATDQIRALLLAFMNSFDDEVVFYVRRSALGVLGKS
jgi:hypothetical protein